MAAVSKNFGWVFPSFDQLCIDNHTFLSFQDWVVMVPYMLVQSMCPSYCLMPLQSHTFSHSPDAALCSLQPFKESNVCCGVRFHHRSCHHACSRHCHKSVNCQWYLVETNCYLWCLKPLVNCPQKISICISLFFLQASLMSFYYFPLLYGLPFSALDVPPQQLGMELNALELFL